MGSGRVRPFPMRSALRLLVLAALLHIGSAFAFTPPTVAYSPTGGTVTPGNLMGSPTWRAWGSLGPSATARDTLRVGVGSAVADMQWNRVLTPANLARGAVRALPFVGTAALIATAFDLVRCRAQGTSILCDLGSEPVMQTVNEYSVGGSNWRSSASAACSAWFQAANGPAGGYSLRVVGYQPNGNATCQVYVESNNSCCYMGSPATTNREVQAQVCPSGQPAGPDGRCATGTFVETAPDTAAQRVVDYSPQWPTNPAQVAQEAAEHVDLAPFAEPAAQPLTGPASVPGPVRTVTTTPPGGGTPTTTQQQTVTNMTYQGNTYNTTTTIVTTNNDGSTTVEERPVEIEVCGLPSTPPCKIDETGTPTPQAITAEADVAARTQDVKARIQDPGSYFPTLPDINWTFSFPTGCAPITLPGFGEFIESLDICQFQGTFHDLMSILWIGGALFGAAAMFWRDQFAG